jgi:excisionase family DNA binding protein
MEITNQTERRLLNVREAAAYLALAPGTLYNLVSKNKIVSVKIGGARRFDINDLNSLIVKLKPGANRENHPD